VKPLLAVLAVQILLGATLIALVATDNVPFVDGDDDGAAAAAPRPKLDHDDRGRPTDVIPNLGCPKTQELAEHLADLGRGGEVARCAQRIAGRVIMRVGRGHVVGDGDRAFVGDAAGEVGGDHDAGESRRGRPPNCPEMGVKLMNMMVACDFS